MLVDFWAEWCGPCKMIAPIVDEIATEYPERVRVGKLDADAHASILERYQIMGIPTLILFKVANQLFASRASILKIKLSAA